MTYTPKTDLKACAAIQSQIHSFEQDIWYLDDVANDLDALCDSLDKLLFGETLTPKERVEISYTVNKLDGFQNSLNHPSSFSSVIELLEARRKTLTEALIYAAASASNFLVDGWEINNLPHPNHFRSLSQGDACKLIAHFKQIQIQRTKNV